MEFSDSIKKIVRYIKEGRPVKVRDLIRSIPRSYFISQEGCNDPTKPVCFYKEGTTHRETPTIEVIVGMLESLDLHENDNLLIIGSKGGYIESLSAIVCKNVYVIDVNEGVVELTRENIDRGLQMLSKQGLKVEGIHILVSDPLEGLPQYAPWDKILIPAAIDEVPQTIFDQLGKNGRLVAPIIESERSQVLKLFEKRGGQIYSRELMGVVFSPLDTQNKSISSRTRRRISEPIRSKNSVTPRPGFDFSDFSDEPEEPTRRSLTEPPPSKKSISPRPRSKISKRPSTQPKLIEIPDFFGDSEKGPSPKPKINYIDFTCPNMHPYEKHPIPAIILSGKSNSFSQKLICQKCGKEFTLIIKVQNGDLQIAIGD